MAIPVPGIGKNTYLQWAREATYGLDLPSDHRHRVKSVTNASKPLLAVPGALQPTVTAPSAIVVGHEARLELATELCYKGHLGLLDLCMGTAAYGSDGAVKSGAGPNFTYTYKQGQLLNSMTAELIAANIPVSKCEQLGGLKVASWELSGGEGKPLLELSMTLLGTLCSTNVTPTAALTAIGTNQIRWADLDAIFDDGSGDADMGVLKSFSLKVDNKINRRDHGALYTAEPLREDYSEVALELEGEFSSRALLDAYLASSAAAPGLTFTTGAANQIDITLPNGYLEPWGRPIETRGIVRQRFTWKASEAATSVTSGLLIHVTCTDVAL